MDRTFRIIEAASAAERLAAAASFLTEHPADQPVTIVAATRGAADDLARRIAVERRATLGLARVSLTQLAARTAIVSLAADGRTPSTALGGEAVAARAVFEATRDASLEYFASVARTPGFPRAVARTLQELRLAGVSAATVGDASRSLAPSVVEGRQDLADLLRRFDVAFAAMAAADRADLFHTAARLLEERPIRGAVLLLDVAINDAAEAAVVGALAKGASGMLATVPRGDRESAARLEAIGGVIEPVAGPQPAAITAGRGTRPASDRPTNDLECLRQFLFETEQQPPERETDGSLELFSAPGEGRECVEMARRVLREARRGVRFDEMAIFVRSPHSYFGLLEHSLRRASVPAWFDRGTRRPHPAGRAFLALVACAAEHLSAARFSEYLSLGQVPQLEAIDDREGGRVSPKLRSSEGGWAASRDDALGRSAAADLPPSEDEEHAAPQAVHADEPVVAGTLRAPWQWERLLIDASVIGQDAARWKRRLDGHLHELRLQLDRLERDGEADTAKARMLALMRDQCGHLERFALPIINELAAWPAEATWGEWLEAFERLAPRVLRMPAYVLRVLADLRPMADIGPIDLDEARRVLADRLLTLEADPPARRFGRVFVGTPNQARGRTFRVVFVPGLAERMFPQKPREDPLLLDTARGGVSASLATQSDRLASERLLLQVAAGAASEKLFVSYPRIELTESRARVPSFYALDVMRAVTGKVPDHEGLEERARMAGNATLAWPAPPEPAAAIDDQEHDLAVLRRLLDEKDNAAVRGHAHYLLGLNDCLRRSVVARWARGQTRWSASDGLIHAAPPIKPALDAARLTTRAYSLSALQRFSACPYQFVLSAVYRLQPLEQPEPLQRMDPLTRGSIFHDIQARCFRELQRRGMLPVVDANVDRAREVLDAIVDDVAEHQHDQLAPAVERVWADEVASIRRDLHAWLPYVARDGGEWEPSHFEYGFGRVPGVRDASSTRDDVVLEGGFRLRGAIDLIETHRQTRVLRVTDHKTGRTPEKIDKVIVGGGAVLQPVLYAMAVEKALDAAVSHGRLFYCTATGSFTEHEIPLNSMTRAAAAEVLQIIDRAIERGFLAAAPAEDACDRCEFVPVCGREVPRRVERKPQDPLADLIELRSRP